MYCLARLDSHFRKYIKNTYFLEGVYFVTIPHTQLSVYRQWEENSFQIRYKYNTNELQIHYK